MTAINDGQYINHIALILDASGSMESLAKDVVQVADNTVKYLAQRSTELDQETRATIYTFDSMPNARGYQHTPRIECVYYDKDVLRLPSLKNKYKPYGGTPLIDATVKAITDLGQTATLYGDHAFLLYVLTDGMENTSKATPDFLKSLIGNLHDNWTLATMVPDQQAIFEAKKFGFPAQNISLWDTSAKGIAEVGEVIRKSTDAFMQARAQGVRGSKDIFNLDLSQLNVKNLQQVSAHDYAVYELPRTESVQEIRPFVESKQGTGTYKLGNTYYELVKTEHIQASKKLCIMDRSNYAVYSGDNARRMLGLPQEEVKVKPTDHAGYAIFVQSTSVNRKVIPGQRIVVMK